MNKITLLALGLVWPLASALAQSDGEFPFVVSGKALEEGIRLHDDKKYKEAIDVYNTVPDNDTAYCYVLHELALTYLSSGDSVHAIETCKKGLALPDPEIRLNFYLTLGNAYDIADSMDKAIATYKEGAALYPYCNKFYYEMGVTYGNHHNDTAAIRCLQQSIRMNPLHASSHLQLARMAARNEKYTLALMSYQMFLLLENSSARSFQALLEMQDLAGGDYKNENEHPVNFTGKTDDFSDLEDIIRSKSALSEKYKTSVKLKYTKLVKPMQAIFEKLEYNKSDQGFWMQTYVPLYVMIWQKGHFDAMMYNSFASLNDEDVAKAIKSNKSKIDAMTEAAGTFAYHDMRHDTLVVNGKKYFSVNRYDDNGFLSSIGFYDSPHKKNTGSWVFFHPGGNIKSEAFYNDNGELEGNYNYYYPSGTLSKKLTFRNGILNGPYAMYYKNGQVREEGTLAEGEPDGRIKYYHATGVLNAEIDYQKGKRNGSEKVYHPNGKMSRDAGTKADKYDGRYTEYSDNGKVKFSVQFKDGIENGIRKTYRADGSLESEGSFVNDKQDGVWKYYYPNGKLQKQGSFTAGKETGTWKDYYRNDSLESETVYSSPGKIDSYRLYDEDGKQYGDLRYSDGAIKKYKYTDKSGKVLSQGEMRGGKLDYLSYNPAGGKNQEGKFVNGKKEGTWTQYHITGKKASEIPYANDERNGEGVYYYKNGKLRERSHYKNDKLDGFSTSYFKTGGVYQQGWFVEGERQGPWNEYYANKKISERYYFLNGEKYGTQRTYDANGRLTFESRYDDNQLPTLFCGYDTTGRNTCADKIVKGSGKLQTMHINGKPYNSATFRNGVKDGDETLTYPNGKKWTTRHFTDGHQDGKEYSYYYNGKVRVERLYRNDNIDSVETRYYESGKVRSRRTFVNDEQEGKSTWYHENGNRSWEGNYVNGNQEGFFTSYAEDGVTVRYRFCYKDDDLISYSYQDKTGNFVPEITLNQAKDKIVAYYPNGNKSAEIDFENGCYEGMRFLYHPNGKKEDEDHYANDNLEGNAKEFYENGQLKADENYVNGDFDGISKYYTDKGILREQVTYVMDDKYGWSIFYDEATGKLKKKILYVNDIPFE